MKSGLEGRAIVFVNCPVVFKANYNYHEYKQNETKQWHSAIKLKQMKLLIIMNGP